MSIRILRRLCVSALALSLATAATSSAAVIFSNLGPGDSYSSNTSWGLVVPNGPFSGASKLASSFVPSGDASVTSVQTAVAYWGSTANQVYSFYLARDVSGRPGTAAEGAILESWSTPPVTTATNSMNALLDLTSTANLTGGERYWLVMSDFTSDSTDPVNGIRTGRWRLNNTGAAGLSAYISSTWNAYGNPSPAFRINGVIPEPATACVVAAAMMGMARRLR